MPGQTLDLLPQFHKRPEALLERADAGTKANLIRQVLQLYKYVADQTLAGNELRVTAAGAYPPLSHGRPPPESAGSTS